MATERTSSLIVTLSSIVRLLSNCGYSSQSEWFQQRLEIIRENDVTSAVSQKTLHELRGIIAGMGSFSDLSLVPHSEVGLTREQANALKWELADRLDGEVTELIQQRGGIGGQGSIRRDG